MIDLGLTDDDMKTTNVDTETTGIERLETEREEVVMVILIGIGNANDDIGDIEMAKEATGGTMNDVVSAEEGIITTTRLRRKGRRGERDDVRGKNDIEETELGMEVPKGTGRGSPIGRITASGSLGPRGDPENLGLNEVVGGKGMMVNLRPSGR